MIENPVLRKELLYRMRPRKGNDTIVGVLVVGILIIGLTYWLFLRWMLTDPSGSTGETAWQMLTVLQYMLICLAAPSVAANAISLEKEQQTWEMLIFTCLTPAEIILGKLIARLAGLFGLVVLLAPISIFAWVLNNSTSRSVPFSQVLLSFILLGVTASFFTTFGLFVSWLFRRTLYAVMASYTFVVGFLCIGTAMVSSGITMITQDYSTPDKIPLMWINPVILIYHVLSSNSSHDTQHLKYFTFGMTIYAVLTVFMIAFMIIKFRRFSYSR